MKKLFYILLFVPLALFGQENDPCYSINNVYQEIEDANLPISLDLLSGWNMIGYGCTSQADAQDLLVSISDKIIIAKNNAGSVYMPEFGFNGIGDLLPNQGYLVKMSETVIGFELCTNPIPFHQVEGCSDCEAINFNRWATSDDGSCQYNTCTDPQADNYQEVLPCIYYGCNDPLAANYDPYANTDDGSCVVAEACPYENYLEYSPDAISYNANLCDNIIVEGCTDNTALNYNSDANVDDNSCEFIYGCIDQEADNYNVEATTDDGSCIYYGCMDPTAGNYDEIANLDDGSCLIGGCMNATAENYNPDAGVDDGSCVIYGCLLTDFPNYNSVANTDDGSCDMSSADVFGCTDESTITYQIEATIDNGICYYGPLPEIGDLILGGIVFYIDETGEKGLIAAQEDLAEAYAWGCYGTDINGDNPSLSPELKYIGSGLQNTLEIVSGCSETPIAASEALAYQSGGYSDWYLPSKDELVEMYNTIGNGSPEGNISDFYSSDYWSSSEWDHNNAWFVNFGSGHSNGVNINDYVTSRVRPIRAFGYTLGCMNENACNFSSEANMSDGSCVFPEEDLDCDLNIAPQYQVGDFTEGGIVFYLDETGQHGLVASMEDLGQFEWGCFEEYVQEVGDVSSLGTGFQNTMNIVTQGCVTENGGITAAQASLDVEINGYSNWYLPSLDELFEMYNTIGNGGLDGNVGSFEDIWYWSSSESNIYNAFVVNLSDGNHNYIIKSNAHKVRVIRSF